MANQDTKQMDALKAKEAEESAAPEAKAREDALEAAEKKAAEDTAGFVRMVKGEHVLHVHPATVKAHTSKGWKAE